MITGQQRGRRHEVIICARSIWLSSGDFSALLALVEGRMSRRQAARLSPVVVCRLRQRLAAAIGRTAADRLIATVGGDKYALAVDTEQITIAPDFRTCVLGASLKRRQAAILSLAEASTEVN